MCKLFNVTNLISFRVYLTRNAPHEIVKLSFDEFYEKQLRKKFLHFNFQWNWRKTPLRFHNKHKSISCFSKGNEKYYRWCCTRLLLNINPMCLSPNANSNFVCTRGFIHKKKKKIDQKGTISKQSLLWAQLWIFYDNVVVEIICALYY